MTTSTSPLYVFVHCPKTAGMSVRQYLHRVMPPKGIAPINEHEDHQYSELDELKSRGDALKIVVGHRATYSLKQHFAPREVRWVTILREPASYLVSRFNWEMKDAGLKPGTEETEARFRAFCQRKKSLQARWFISVFAEQEIAGFQRVDPEEFAQRAGDILEEFWHIGRLESLRQSLKPLFVALGVSPAFDSKMNRSGKDYPRLITLNEEWRKYIHRYTKADRILYKRFTRKHAPLAQVDSAAAE